MWTACSDSHMSLVTCSQPNKLKIPPQWHRIAKSSDSADSSNSSVDSGDSGSELLARSSSVQASQRSPKLGERNRHFSGSLLSGARNWNFAFYRPSKPSDPAPNEKQTALELDASEDEHVHLFLQTKHQLPSWASKLQYCSRNPPGPFEARVKSP